MHRWKQGGIKVSLSQNPQECWWNVEGYDGKYQVSSCGRIKSFANNGKKPSKAGKILNDSLTDRGYVRVTLRDGISTKYPKVHRLVAFAFLENPYRP